MPAAGGEGGDGLALSTVMWVCLLLRREDAAGWMEELVRGEDRLDAPMSHRNLIPTIRVRFRSVCAALRVLQLAANKVSGAVSRESFIVLADLALARGTISS